MTHSSRERLQKFEDAIDSFEVLQLFGVDLDRTFSSLTLTEILTLNEILTLQIMFRAEFN